MFPSVKRNAKTVRVVGSSRYRGIESTSCLENKTAAQLIRDAITAIRNNNKRPDGQSVFKYIHKTSATNMDQKYFTS